MNREKRKKVLCLQRAENRWPDDQSRERKHTQRDPRRCLVNIPGEMGRRKGHSEIYTVYPAPRGSGELIPVKISFEIGQGSAGHSPFSERMCFVWASLMKAHGAPPFLCTKRLPSEGAWVFPFLFYVIFRSETTVKGKRCKAAFGIVPQD